MLDFPISGPETISEGVSLQEVWRPVRGKVESRL